jgi:hypothetical protein
METYVPGSEVWQDHEAMGHCHTNNERTVRQYYAMPFFFGDSSTPCLYSAYPVQLLDPVANISSYEAEHSCPRQDRIAGADDEMNARPATGIRLHPHCAWQGREGRVHQSRVAMESCSRIGLRLSSKEDSVSARRALQNTSLRLLSRNSLVDSIS